MRRYEGILVTWNSHMNTSAAGARLEEGFIELDIYHPSDSARNLRKNPRFTFSLVDDPSLFYKASLKGHDEPGYQELAEDLMENKAGFYYPQTASIVHLCEVSDLQDYELEDELGKTTVSKVNARIIEKFGEGRYIQREDPLVDSMVYATRVPLAEGKYKEKLKEKIYKILENKEDKITEKILDLIEGY
ncbi:MAG: DUF447 family protein [Candidatus Saliniplasma sp.]